MNKKVSELAADISSIPPAKRTVRTAKFPPIEFSYSEEELRKLISGYSNITSLSPGDVAEYENIKLALAELRKARTTIENERKDQKSASLKHGREIDSGASWLTGFIKPVEDSLSALKKSEDERIERERVASENLEKDRTERLETILATVSQLPMQHTLSTSNQIQDAIDEMDAMVKGDLDEYMVRIMEAKASVMGVLVFMRDAKSKSEQEARDAAAEQEKQDQLAAEELEKERDELAELRKGKQPGTVSLEEVAAQDTGREEDSLKIVTDEIREEEKILESLDELSVEQMVRNILQQAIEDDLVCITDRIPKFMSNGDLVECANLLSGYLRDA